MCETVLLPLFVLWFLNIHALLLLFLFCRNTYSPILTASAVMGCRY